MGCLRGVDVGVSLLVVVSSCRRDRPLFGGCEPAILAAMVSLMVALIEV